MELLGARPGRKAISYFLLAIGIGTILLLLPISAGRQPVTFIDAIFTATSAVCVTGLTVLDTQKDFSAFGQVVIMLLIQLGGLGIMTFATGLLMMAGARLPHLDRLGVLQTFGNGTMIKTGHLILAIVITTFTFELVGALMLFLNFRHAFPPGQALFHAVFHSISAFCNAGFSTFSGGLEGYQANILIITIFSILIIFGGLGFVVIHELFNLLIRKNAKLSLHSKICLTTSAVLLFVGMVAFLIAEKENIFAGKGLTESIANAFFQAVTARTAGFNTIPQSALTEVSLLITLILMFIGACPGSTGGGIKTTTFAVILLLVFNRFLGRQSVRVFNRSVNPDSIVRAATVILLAVLVIVSIFTLLMFAEEKPVSHMLSHGWFVDNLFETVSAFGTVGLSLGITSHVHYLGKLILIVTMFIGRVGLLTLAFALARPPRPGEIVYPDELVMIG